MANQNNERLELDRAIRALKRNDEFLDHLKTVGYYPHTGQVPILKRLLQGQIKRMFLQCSRNFGKSTTIGILAAAKAGCYPNRKVYIVAPYRTQADEIYNASGFIDAIIPTAWKVEGDRYFNATQLRWRLKNGSYIKLDGADNETALRGYKPTDLFADEFQGWRKEAWQAMEPNMLAHSAAVVFAGTPPDMPGVFTDMADFVKAREKEKNYRYAFIKRTIYDNPRFDPAEVEEIRKGFIERGEEAIWRREYMAEYVPGGASSIFPMFSEKENTRPIEWILEYVERDKHRLTYYTISDPSGSRSAHGVIGFNPFTAEMFLFDEVVETDAKFLSCAQLSPRITEKEKMYISERARHIRIYDEAAKLFQIEMASLGLSYSPTSKRQNEKSNNISLMRDMLIKKKLIIADHCKHTISDIFNYHTEVLPSGKIRIVKVKDDCVDMLLYAIAESGYSFNTKPFTLPSERRFYTPEEELVKKSDEEEIFQAKVETDLDDDFFEGSLWQ